MAALAKLSDLVTRAPVNGLGLRLDFPEVFLEFILDYLRSTVFWFQFSHPGLLKK